MTAYNIDFINFKEQISNLLISDVENNYSYSTVLYTDLLPITKNFNAKAELFNIIPEKNYLILLYIFDEKKNANLLSANRLNVLSEDLQFITKEKLGKTAINFEFILPLEEEKDYCISMQLIEEETTNMLSHKEIYLSVRKGV